MLLVALSSCGQQESSCKVIQLAYETIIDGKYRDSYIADKYALLNDVTEDYLSYLFGTSINKKILNQVVSNFRRENDVKKFGCFPSMILVNKDSILEKLSENREIKVSADSSFVKFVIEKDAEIAKAQNDDVRIKLQNELTSTEEFKKYIALVDYNTPRLIQFTRPNFVEQYCFIKIDVMKNHSDDSNSMMCVLEKIQGTWKLIRAVSY
jgi:hypothetical protein